MFGSFSLVLYEICDNIILCLWKLPARIIYYFHHNWRNNLFSYLCNMFENRDENLVRGAWHIFSKRKSSLRRRDDCWCCSRSYALYILLYKRNIRWNSGTPIIVYGRIPFRGEFLRQYSKIGVYILNFKQFNRIYSYKISWKIYYTRPHRAAPCRTERSSNVHTAGASIIRVKTVYKREKKR